MSNSRTHSKNATKHVCLREREVLQPIFVKEFHTNIYQDDLQIATPAVLPNE